MKKATKADRFERAFDAFGTFYDEIEFYGKWGQLILVIRHIVGLAVIYHVSVRYGFSNQLHVFLGVFLVISIPVYAIVKFDGY